MDLQHQYDDAMFDFSRGDFESAIARLRAVLATDPAHFAAQLSLKPKEQLVHTNLSLFYMKAGDKKTAEHHGLQARIASWRDDKSAPGAAPVEDLELALAKPSPPAMKPPEKFPEMPWKKKPPAGH